MLKKFFSSLVSPEKETTENYLPEKKPAYYFTVAGTFGERQTRIQKKSFKDSGNRHDLILIPEPENPVDKNAIMVYAKRIGQIGYVPAEIAKEINQFMLKCPSYALTYEKVDARPWDPSDEDLDVEVKLYALNSSEALIAAEQKAEQEYDFTDLESAYICAAKRLYPHLSLSGAKDKTYIHIEWGGHTFLTLKIGKRLQYALLPADFEHLDQIDLAFEDPTKTEIGNIRAMLPSPDDTIKLKPYLDEQEKNITKKILWFDQLYSDMSKIK
ncbi:MAG: HIRAN domain-containing protein [Peptococcaceae bacterium]|nr:HIRAN domain-containing protein [Peptococcaceae bacterium]